MGWEALPGAALIFGAFFTIPYTMGFVHRLFQPNKPRRVHQDAWDFATQARDDRLIKLKEAQVLLDKKIEKDKKGWFSL